MITFLTADSRCLPLPDESVQCVVTSPPYWGLRDYGVEPLVWGSIDECAHEWGDLLPSKPGRGNKPGEYSTSALTNPARQDEAPRASNSGCWCQSCGAWRGSLGLEPTPDLYVQHLVTIMREIRRVLRDDGTLWLNLGDCYQSGSHGGYDRNRSGVNKNLGHDMNCADFSQAPNRLPQDGLKNKDLIGIPWRVAFALQADGWYLRNDIIWSKAREFCAHGVVGSCMPENVEDRPTRAHEYVFLLSKSARYYYDIEATEQRGVFPAGTRAAKGSGTREGNRRGGLKKQDGIGTAARAHDRTAKGFNDRYFCPPANDGYAVYSGKRRLRDVWCISPKPYKEAHFATFPVDLVVPCVQAATKPGDLVLDPFGGAGTTALTCHQMGRRCVSVDLKPDYTQLAVTRLARAGYTPYPEVEWPS